MLLRRRLIYCDVEEALSIDFGTNQVSYGGAMIEVLVESIRLEASQMSQRQSDLKRPNVTTAKRPKNVFHLEVRISVK